MPYDRGYAECCDGTGDAEHCIYYLDECQTYPCQLCGAEKTWCQGCCDEEDIEHNGICDDCWCKLTGEGHAT
jgi:hypothetical protein